VLGLSSRSWVDVTPERAIAPCPAHRSSPPRMTPGVRTQPRPAAAKNA